MGNSLRRDGSSNAFNSNVPPISDSAVASSSSSSVSTSIVSTDSNNRIISSRKDRAKSCIIGAFLSDAATMPLHLIYDQSIILSLISTSNSTPEFMLIPHGTKINKFYHYETGRLSPYGDDALPLLASLTSKGHLDVNDIREEMYSYYSQYDGRLNRSSKIFVESKENGNTWDACACCIDDVSFTAVVKIPLIVARYAGSSSLIDKLDSAIRINHSNEKVLIACRLLARLLEKVIMGNSIVDTIEWAMNDDTGIISYEGKEYLNTVTKIVNQCNSETCTLSYADIVEKFGLNNNLPGVLLASLYGLLTMNSYEACVKANIIAGGDSVCRCWIMCPFFAAEGGDMCMPTQWKVRTFVYNSINTMTTTLLGSNPYLVPLKEQKCRLPFA